MNTLIFVIFRSEQIHTLCMELIAECIVLSGPFMKVMSMTDTFQIAADYLY